MERKNVKHFFQKILFLFFIISLSPITVFATTSFNTADFTYQYDIPLNNGAGLHLIYTSDPGLNIFHNSFGVFYELEGEPSRQNNSLENNKNKIYIDTRLFTGLINMPNFAGPSHLNWNMGSDLEKSLLLGGTQLGIGYNKLYHLSPDLGLQIGIRNDSFLRLAYNLYDLKPSLAELGAGSSLQKVLSSRFSGGSYSTLQNRLGAELGLVSDVYSLTLSYTTQLTDLLYKESSFGVSFSKDRSITMTLAYDWASYDKMNGISGDGLSAKLALEWFSNTLNIEGEYRVDGTLGFAVYSTVAIDGLRNENDKERIDVSSFGYPLDNTRPAQKVEKDIEISLIKEAEKIGWDETLLKKNDMSLEEIGAVLKANKISRKYDYSRVTSIDYTMRTPEEYIKQGGICRDAANAVANILENNGYEAKIVYTKQVEQSPHAFVVTKDSDGSYYIVNYEKIYEVQGAKNMAQTASSYSQFLTLYLMDPHTHRVTDVVVSPDSGYLERIAGMK